MIATSSLGGIEAGKVSGREGGGGRRDLASTCAFPFFLFVHFFSPPPQARGKKRAASHGDLRRRVNNCRNNCAELSWKVAV